VLNALPKSVQPAARRALAEIRDAEDKAHAEAAIKAFADEFEAKWPKAVAKITDKPDALLAFYDMPAEHWIHLKTTNPIESTFATVRLRTKVTIATAESRWRAVNAPHLVALVRAGALFHNGVLVERSEEVAA
jgi:transposase-like protein